MWKAVAQSPHQLSLSPKALAHFAEESIEKVQAGQAKPVLLNDIQDNLPAQVKILPIAAIPHKLKAFCSILDLSFCLQLKHGGFLDSGDGATVKRASQGALDPLRHALSQIIRLFADQQKDCAADKEYNFAHILPQDK
jgi:hypothetical protein